MKFFLAEVLCTACMNSHALNVRNNNDDSAPEPDALPDLTSLNKGLRIIYAKTNALLTRVTGLLIYTRSHLKSEEFKHRGTVPILRCLRTIGRSYTERVKLESKTLCNSVSLYLSVENTFEIASTLLSRYCKQFLFPPAPYCTCFIHLQKEAA